MDCEENELDNRVVWAHCIQSSSNGIGLAMVYDCGIHGYRRVVLYVHTTQYSVKIYIADIDTEVLFIREPQPAYQSHLIRFSPTIHTWYLLSISKRWQQTLHTKRKRKEEPLHQRIWMNSGLVRLARVLHSTIHNVHNIISTCMCCDVIERYEIS